MLVRAYSDPIEFHARVRGFLDRDEAVNTAPIGIIERLATDPSGARALGWGNPILLMVEENDEVVCVAVKTEVRNLLVTPGPPIAIAMLADHLARHRAVLPGVAGPEAPAKNFVTAWRKLNTIATNPIRFLRLFRCDRVAEAAPVAGNFAPATIEHLDTMAEWLNAFHTECGHAGASDALRNAEVKVSEGSIFVWRDAGPVSMASFNARTARSARISAVYTPPAHRRRGYASAVVAYLTRQLLASGLPQSLLFTDLANPTSNSIYRKIGYVPIADFHEYAFAPK